VNYDGWEGVLPKAKQERLQEAPLVSRPHPEQNSNGPRKVRE
jgi:hypothetical protein